MKNYMQRMGRSLMLPVATLPVAALFMGIGYWIDPAGWGGNNILAAFLLKAGGTILDNLGLLFAVGLALGMSKDKDGASALAGVIAFLTPMTLVSSASVAMFKGIDIEQVSPAFAAINNKNVFVGILAGLIAAAMYNRFSKVQLPMALAFFSGRRLVPIVTAGVMAIISAALIFVWPPVYNTLVSFGEMISGMGAIGAGIYGFFNRLLIPTGLHHALNNVFWFNLAGIDDIGKFWASDGIKGITGMYQAGFFPVMMFGLPAGALAIYQCARPEKKKATASLMLAAAFASFFTGVTEPLEFSFMFVAWPLYVVHAVLTGISMFIAATFHWTAGFNFSAGFVDFILSLRVPIANQPYMLLVQGIVFAFIYYFTFMFVIKKFNLMTPGREEDNGEESEDIDTLNGFDNKFQQMASKLYDALGGRNNLLHIDNCTTRLRLQVKNMSNVNESKIKSTGVPGIKIIDDHNIQIIVGTEVQFVADELLNLKNNQNSLKDEKKIEVYSPSKGKLIDISNVSDDVFSQKMMGEGFAVIPTSNEIYTPIEGVVTSVFPTKHAIGLVTESGVEILVHVGIDTVELKGEPFDVKINKGDYVRKNDVLMTVDLEKLYEANKNTDVVVVITNSEKIHDISLIKTEYVDGNECIGQINMK